MMRRLLTLVVTAAVLVASGSAALAAPPQTVTYGIVGWNPLHWVVMVGGPKGHFERHGVKLDIVITGSAGAAVQAMIGGSLHMTTSSPAAAFLAQAKAPEMQQIIGVFERCPYTLVVNPDIKKIEDLRGKVVGGTGVKTGADTESLRVMLHAHGFQDPRDYTVAAVGSVRERSQALLNKTIWAVAQMEPLTSVLKDRGMVELTRASEYPNLKLLQMVVVVAMRPWYTANADTVTRFLRGWNDATAWLYDPKNKDEATKILADRMKVDERYAANAYRVFVTELRGFPAQGRLNLAAVRQAAENQKMLGVPPPADIAAYVDTGPVEKAFGK